MKDEIKNENIDLIYDKENNNKNKNKRRSSLNFNLIYRAISRTESWLNLKNKFKEMRILYQ